MAVLALGLLWLNGRPYLAPVTQPDSERVPKNAVSHLAWIREKLADGAGQSMQRLFPEGFFFCHALYGLAWVEIGLRSAEHRVMAAREARRALTNVESAAGKEAFLPELPPGHGMFYAGWRNHLQAGVVLLTGDEGEKAQLRSRCDALVQALTASPAWPWLASYRDQVWPCDAPPGIHAMCVYDSVTGEDRYADFAARWLEAVNQNLSPEFGMVTHVADPGSGRPLGPPRATSQTIILRFLADIDPTFASAQYERFQTHFHDSILGVPAILEYPHGIDAPGDVDSGPLIAGVSASATVVGMGVAQIYGDHEFSRAISQFGETVGLPCGIGRRRYLGGMLPVGDAFVVHATTARPWLQQASSFTVRRTPVSVLWRSGIHLVSSLGVALAFLIWRGGRRRRRKLGSLAESSITTEAGSE
jgi:hypothetical protein